MRRWIWAMAGMAVLLGGVVLWRLADHDLGHWQSEVFDFTADETRLTGTLWQPGSPPVAAVVLVHGDGPQDRSLQGGYAPMINMLLESGIAVASWDKPGVGGSSGNWLDQSMADRAEEVRTAVLTLRQRVPGLPVGALGFSQAGWVLPRLGSADADFLVLVGPAVSWRQQGDYYDRVNLAHQGLKDPEIDDELARMAAEDDRRFAPTALYHAVDIPDGMSQDRWAFIQRNRDVDARGELHKLQVPLLAIWGADDLNVDTAHDAAIYRQIFMAAQNGTQIVVVPKAAHGLLKSGAYNWQLTDDWSLVAKLRFLLEGRYAYAPKALPTIIDWIDRQALSRRD